MATQVNPDREEPHVNTEEHCFGEAVAHDQDEDDDVARRGLYHPVTRSIWIARRT